MNIIKKSKNIQIYKQAVKFHKMQNNTQNKISNQVL